MRSKPIPLLFLILLACTSSVAQPLHIGVAASFRPTLNKILQRYQADTGQRCLLSSASTGTLYAQAVNGAGFDVLLAADSARPARLVSAGLARADSIRTYAIGKLALVSREALPAQVSTAEIARRLSTGPARIALANPDTAPYGQAAKQVLQQLGLWHAIADRRIAANNAAQALQFFSSGNTDFAFIALAQWVNWPQRGDNGLWRVPDHLYPAIRQDAVILSNSTQQAAAARFLAYLTSRELESLLKQDGYEPGRPQ